jgi:putative membrane protein
MPVDDGSKPSCLSAGSVQLLEQLTVVGPHVWGKSRSMKSFLKRLLITGLAVVLAAYIVPGITVNGPHGLLLAALLLAVLNAFVRPVMVVLALPLLIFTLGLFMLVINAVLLYWVGRLLQPNFTVETFPAAIWGSLIISFVSLVLNSLTKSGDSRLQFHKGGRPPPPPKDDGGPIIDV